MLLKITNHSLGQLTCSSVVFSDRDLAQSDEEEDEDEGEEGDADDDDSDDDVEEGEDEEEDSGKQDGLPFRYRKRAGQEEEDADEDMNEGEEEETDSEGETANGKSERVAGMEMSGEEGEGEGEEGEEGDNGLRWKDDMIRRAAEIFKREPNIMEVGIQSLLSLSLSHRSVR